MLAADVESINTAMDEARKERVVLRDDLNAATGLAQEVEHRTSL